jgi:hypothetical protein
MKKTKLLPILFLIVLTGSIAAVAAQVFLTRNYSLTYVIGGSMVGEIYSYEGPTSYKAKTIATGPLFSGVGILALTANNNPSLYITCNSSNLQGLGISYSGQFITLNPDLNSFTFGTAFAITTGTVLDPTKLMWTGVAGSGGLAITYTVAENGKPAGSYSGIGMHVYVGA